MRRSTVLCCLAVAIFSLIYPIYVIRPFRHQGARELAFALQVMRWRFPVLIACSLIAIAATVRSRKVVMIAATLLTVACAAFSRVNVYEQMFHPLGEPQFVPISETKLTSDEKVIAVTLNRAARAYPVRGISYHHIVNDTLSGVPIVATY